MDALSQALLVLPLLILKLSLFEEKCISLTFVFSFGWVYSDPEFYVCKMRFAARVLLQGEVWWKGMLRESQILLKTQMS